MPRPLRITVPNLCFHILNRGNNRQEVFLENEDFIYFIKLLAKYKKELKFKIYHFCLMPNHTHFMIEPTIENSLPKIMMRTTLSYSLYFNKKYNRVGHVWQGRYKSSLIDKENYFIWCGLYNELNPIRAKLIENLKDWRWSSFNFYASEEKDFLIEKIIDIDPYYLELGSNTGERREKYVKNIDEILKQESLINTRTMLNKGIFGRTEFIEEMKDKFKIDFLKGRGRPAKKI